MPVLSERTGERRREIRDIRDIQNELHTQTHTCNGQPLERVRAQLLSIPCERLVTIPSMSSRRKMKQRGEIELCASWHWRVNGAPDFLFQAKNLWLLFITQLLERGQTAPGWKKLRCGWKVCITVITLWPGGVFHTFTIRLCANCTGVVCRNKCQYLSRVLYFSSLTNSFFSVGATRDSSLAVLGLTATFSLSLCLRLFISAGMHLSFCLSHCPSIHPHKEPCLHLPHSLTTACLLFSLSPPFLFSLLALGWSAAWGFTEGSREGGLEKTRGRDETWKEGEGERERKGENREGLGKRVEQ